MLSLMKYAMLLANDDSTVQLREGTLPDIITQLDLLLDGDLVRRNEMWRSSCNVIFWLLSRHWKQAILRHRLIAGDISESGSDTRDI